MPKQNLIKILIPVVAVVVVLESIVLVSKLDRNASVNTSSEEIIPTEEIRTPVADFVFETDTKEMEVGKSYEVNLTLVGIKTVSLDAIEAYINYDPEKLTVSKLITNKDLPEALNSEINSKTGLISSIFLWDVGEVYSIVPEQTFTVLSFTITPKTEGDTEITLNTTEEDSDSTLLVESVTSNQLSFLSNKLEVSVSK